MHDTNKSLGMSNTLAPAASNGSIVGWASRRQFLPQGIPGRWALVSGEILAAASPIISMQRAMAIDNIRSRSRS
jgi:hypothetical protein